MISNMDYDPPEPRSKGLQQTDLADVLQDLDDKISMFSERLIFEPVSYIEELKRDGKRLTSLRADTVGKYSMAAEKLRSLCKDIKMRRGRPDP